MELLLNILWLMLAVPAMWLWLRDPAVAGKKHWHGHLRPLLVLACVLALLFPVVSATDDLHAMRSEMEEPGPCKRTVRQWADNKSSLWPIGFGVPAAHLFGIPSTYTGNELCGWVWAFQEPLPPRLQRGPSGCRAPPVSQVG
jgi:hypothetical protein